MSTASCPLPEHSGLPKGTKHMSDYSEKTSSLLEELDRWSESHVISRIYAVEIGEQDWKDSLAETKKAIRSKVYEGYWLGVAEGQRRRAEEGKVQQR